MFFRIGLRRSVVHHPGLANSQHREDMSKAPPSLTLGSVVSAVFGGRWACTHLEPMPALEEPRQPHVRIRSPLRPSTCSSSFVQPLFFLTASVPASTSTLYTPYLWLSLFSDGPLHTFEVLDHTAAHLSPPVGDPSDSLNRARDSVEES